MSKFRVVPSLGLAPVDLFDSEKEAFAQASFFVGDGDFHVEQVRDATMDDFVDTALLIGSVKEAMAKKGVDESVFEAIEQAKGLDALETMIVTAFDDWSDGMSIGLITERMIKVSEHNDGQ